MGWAARLCVVGFCGGPSRAWLACPGSLRLMSGPSAAGLMPIVRASSGVRQSEGCRVVSPSARGRLGARATSVGGVSSHISRSAPSVLGGSSGHSPRPRGCGKPPVWCPSAAGDRLQRAGHACAVLGGARQSRWCRLACSRGRVPGFGSRWVRALRGCPDVARGRCGGH